MTKNRSDSLVTDELVAAHVILIRRTVSGRVVGQAEDPG
jgi:hypothetical protein